MEYNVLSELERYGLKIHDWRGEDTVRITCPFHPDESPSCDVDIKKRVFLCRSGECGAHGDVITLLARFAVVTRVVIETDLAKRYGATSDKTIDPQLVERYHDQIWDAHALRGELYKRGLIDDDIRKHRLGFDGESRITIPIRNGAGHFVNLRKYLPGAPGAEKMKNTKGYGAPVRFFPYDQLKFDRIVICGGECKAIVAARELNPHGIGALCATQGESNWSADLTRDLVGKHLWTLLDIDKAGQKSALDLCIQLHSLAVWIGNAALPLDPDKYPKGDINDYVALGGKLLPILESATEFVPPTSKLQYTTDDQPEPLELTASIDAERAGKRVAVTALCSMVDTAPYVIPKDIVVICKRDQKYCGPCPVYQKNKNEFSVPPESPAILEMVAAHKAGQLDVLKEAIDIPKACRACEIEAHTHYNIEDARIQSPLDITNRTADRTMQPALCIGKRLELNETYSFTGRMFPHPKTQQAVMLFSSYTPTKDALSSYECSGLDRLSVFWPEQWDVASIQQKLDHIYSDFESNVTHVFKRRDMHLMMDLVYHSPLFITFDGKVVKGWLEIIVAGDSAQAKSEVACGSDEPGGLMQHYGLGEKIVCKHASVAGLLGGCQKNGDRYFISWGSIPQQDGRLGILEEVKGTSIETIGALTDMRSSGVAKITKIERRSTKARVRLIWLSNLRGDMRLDQHSFGVVALKELIGGLEDIRRFDAALLVSRHEIDPAELNLLQQSRPVVPHVFTSEVCRSLVLWNWTRRPNQIEFTSEATELILAESTALCEQFTDAIPLVDRGSMRYKLARLSAALAGRLFSCSDDFSSLIIYPAHVEYICALLRRIYSSRVFGYADYTAALKVTQSLINADEIKLKINTTPHAVDLVRWLLATNKIELSDLQDWCGWQRDEAQVLLSFFVRKHALMRDGKQYRKTSPFIELLKRMLDNGEVIDVPPYIPRVDY
jgi:hypothetical protein